MTNITKRIPTRTHKDVHRYLLNYFSAPVWGALYTKFGVLCRGGNLSRPL